MQSVKRILRPKTLIFKGVSKDGNKWHARLWVNTRSGKKNKYLGSFSSEIEAAKCHDYHARCFLGTSAITNFQDLEKEEFEELWNLK